MKQIMTETFESKLISEKKICSQTLLLKAVPNLIPISSQSALESNRICNKPTSPTSLLKLSSRAPNKFRIQLWHRRRIRDRSPNMRLLARRRRSCATDLVAAVANLRPMMAAASQICDRSYRRRRKFATDGVAAVANLRPILPHPSQICDGSPTRRRLSPQDFRQVADVAYTSNTFLLSSVGFYKAVAFILFFK